MGDDLLAARAFVDDAQTHLETLLGQNRFDDGLARKAIADIRKAAKPLQARAILRSGQRALDLLEAQASKPKIDGAYFALNKLILQYRQGLEEIEQAESLPSYLAAPCPAQDCEAFRLAKDTLSSVLKFSRNTEHKQALAFLSGLILEGPAAEAIQHQTMPQITPQILPEAETARDTDFEDLMPSLTNCVLIAARRNDKTVSLGYSAHDVQLPAGTVDRVEKKLQALGRFLVDNIMESRDIRSARGDSQSGQILITANADTATITIDMECKGRGLSKVQKDAISGADSLIQVSCHESGSVTTIRLIVRKTKALSQAQPVKRSATYVSQKEHAS